VINGTLVIVVLVMSAFLRMASRRSAFLRSFCEGDVAVCQSTTNLDGQAECIPKMDFIHT
jgi:hypothetical protein